CCLPIIIPQLSNKPEKPSILSLCIPPTFYVLSNSLEYRSTQFEGGIDAMKRRRPLQVESPVVLRQHVLAIRLFSHFHVRNWIAALLQVSHLRGRIFRRAI